jgi:hypothetical protein
MFGIADYPAFVLAVIVFLAIPGPGNLALLTSTAKGGLRGGLLCGLIDRCFFLGQRKLCVRRQKSQARFECDGQGRHPCLCVGCQPFD